MLYEEKTQQDFCQLGNYTFLVFLFTLLNIF
jgi:hypothetical protein